MKKEIIKLTKQEIITLKNVLADKLSNLRLGRIIDGKPFKRASSYEARIREIYNNLTKKNNS